jgi:hypothetical protein
MKGVEERNAVATMCTMEATVLSEEGMVHSRTMEGMVLRNERSFFLGVRKEEDIQ